MTTPTSAVEFAQGLGHPSFPLLDAGYAPGSAIPCVDFSPWIRDRISEQDDLAVVAYALQVTAATSGISLSVEESREATPAIGDVETSTPDVWDSPWVERVTSILRDDFEDLDGLGQRAHFDLQTALVVLLSRPLSLLSLRADLTEEDSPGLLAAMMAPHEEVRVRDPRAAAERVSSLLAHERAKRYGLAIGDIADPTPADFVVPLNSTLSRAPAVLQDLPLASRSHLVDISTLSRGRDVGPAGRFWSFYRTRRVGWHAERSMSVLIEHGLLRLCDDADILLDYRTMSLTAGALREHLTNAGIAFGRSASKSELAGLARPLFSASAQDEPIYELTQDGRRAVDWIAAQASRTTRMWRLWAASRAAE